LGTTNKLLIDLCFASRADGSANCPNQKTGVKTYSATFFTIIKAKAITAPAPDDGHFVTLSDWSWNGVCNSTAKVPLCRSMMGTNLGVAPVTSTAITNNILWLYDDNSEHAHRIS
jgi:hypothetical protein